MIEKMKALLKGKDMCVLATCSDNKPHCSLMAYVCNEAGNVVYMTTLKNTQKYRNLKQNPHVSLLIDTRGAEDVQRSATQALTVTGIYSPPRDQNERKSILAQIMERHPHLAGIVDQPDAEVLCIKVDSFLLLDGAIDAHFEKLA